MRLLPSGFFFSSSTGKVSGMNFLKGIASLLGVSLILAVIGIALYGLAQGLYIESHPVVSYRWEVRVTELESGRDVFNKEVINRFKPHVSQEGQSVSVSWSIGPGHFDREEHSFPANTHVSIVRKGYYKRPGVVYREGHTLLPAD